MGECRLCIFASRWDVQGAAGGGVLPHEGGQPSSGAFSQCRHCSVRSHRFGRSPQALSCRFSSSSHPPLFDTLLCLPYQPTHPCFPPCIDSHAMIEPFAQLKNTIAQQMAKTAWQLDQYCLPSISQRSLMLQFGCKSENCWVALISGF